MTQRKTQDNDHIMNPKYSWTLSNKFRNWTQPPLKMLDNNIKAGMRVLDFGCGNGYMTFPLAQIVGKEGKIYAVDLQQEMLNELELKSRSMPQKEQIEFHRCEPEAVNLNKKVDAVVCCYVLHEVPNKTATLQDFYSALEDKGVFHLIEPPFHVTKKQFSNQIDKALEVGFKLVERKRIGLNHVALFSK